jgi:hypothetical protein
MTVSLNTGLVTLPDGSQFDLKDSGIFSVDGKDYPVLSVLLKDGTTDDRWTNMAPSLRMERKMEPGKLFGRRFC